MPVLLRMQGTRYHLLGIFHAKLQPAICFCLTSCRGQSSPVICELFLHELQLAGEKIDRTCNSLDHPGQRPKMCLQTVMNASIGRLYLSTVATPSEAADVSQRDRAPFCIATSPVVSDTAAQCPVRPS